MTEVTPDWKPEQRVRASKPDWVKLYELKMGPCRVCGQRLADWAMSLHHVLSKSLGGGDVAENLVPLCGSGTTGCHGLIEAHDVMAGWKLRQALTAEEIAYVANAKGFDYLDRRYGEYGSGPLGEDGDAVDGAAPVLAEREPQADTPASEMGRSDDLHPSRSATCPTCLQPIETESSSTSGTAAEPPVEKREKPRRKKSWRVSVPDDHEDGKAVLDALVDACRAELAPTLGYDGEVPVYFVVTASLAAFLRGEKAQAA